MMVRMRQHPVGQGGLFSGVLSNGHSVSPGTSEFRWVYDCGSNQQMCRDREIGYIAASGSIQVLFLSHLDSDHVNGIARLLENTEVQEVVLPYLDWTEHILLIAADLATGTYSTDFMNFMADPAAWLIARGAQTVTFFDGGDSPPPDGPTLPSVDPADDGHFRGPKWVKKPEIIDHSADGRVQKVEASNTLHIPTSRGAINWILAPHVYRPSDRILRGFRSALRAEYGAILSSRRLLPLLEEKDERDRLRACYDHLWLDHNLVSMSLYSGPVEPWRGQTLRPFNPDRSYLASRSNAVGWISTGDMNLQRHRRRKQFLQYYGRFRDLVGCLVVPHHGSAHNFHPEIITAYPNLHTSIAASGTNAYGHPHDQVRHASIAASGGIFHVVGEAASTALEIQGTLP